MNIHTVPSVYQNTRCTFTTGSVEAGPSEAKRRPAVSFRSKDFIHRVDVVAPDSWNSVLEQVARRTPTHYYRVTATLGQIFEKQLFRDHVKTGNLSMLSEGNPISGNTFTLCRGKLKLYLDRETYERSGLLGSLDEQNGNREMRSKWLVAYDLQSPSMQHGKRGFDRMVYGCKTISDTPLNWICALEDSSEEPTALGQLSYKKVLSKPVSFQPIKTHQVMTPIMPSCQDDGPGGRDAAAELYEWISLVRLRSPRVLYNDGVDPYLSRYIVPDCTPGEMSVGHTGWDGLLSSSWVSNLVSALMTACPEDSWFTVSATDLWGGGLGGKSEITVLKPPGQRSRYLMWDIKHS